ncbi:MAG: CBS domain-containing protein [Gemmatimonadales bacterium]
MSAGQICSRIVVTASPLESVRTAARRMAEHQVGTLVVVKPVEQVHPVGILTDRDITIRCVAAGLDPERTRIEELMTQPVQTVEEHTPLPEAIALMASGATRRMVVTGDAGRLVGLLSLDDLLDALIDETIPIGRLLERQRPHVSA